jgi:uncharacterized Tic20 family protein
MDEPKPNADTPDVPDVQGDELSKDACTFGMLAHLLGAIIGFLGPLIIWLIKKDEHPFVDDQGKEALNFHLTLLIVYAGLVIVSFVTCGIGALLYPFVYLVQIIFGIIGAVKANGGELYRYPFNIRMIQ